MRLQNYINEKYLDTIENRWGKTRNSPTGYDEIFTNPSPKELRDLDINNIKMYSLILPDNNTAIFFPDHVIHEDIINYLGLNRNNTITLRIIIRGTKDIELTATSTMRKSPWKGKPDELLEYVKKHKYMKKFNIIKYDADGMEW